MLSSFSRLLPTNVSVSAPDFLKLSNPGPTRHEAQQQQALPKPPVDSQTSTTTESANGTAENEASGASKERSSKIKKRKDTALTATETFIIVRPPPSMSNHPLNLQVQLVASSGRGGILTRSANNSRDTLNDGGEGNAGGVSLKRTSSLRSNRSDTESMHSASSSFTAGSIVSATSQSGSGSSSGRRMIPLYNLHAHNVMTNVITDAGTDAKIAKFFKRGLEIMGLAMLEPVEVYGRYAWNDSLDVLDPHTVNVGGGSGFSTQVTRTISQLSALSIQPIQRTASGGQTDGNEAGAKHELPTVIEIPSSPTTPKPVEKESGPAKKLFGNLFKKKKEPPAPLALESRASSEMPVTPLAAKRRSMAPSLFVSSPKSTTMSTPITPSMTSSVGMMTPSSALASSHSTTGENITLQPQILGLQAVLQAPGGVVPTKGRPSTYVWVVRKWVKGGDEGILGAMVDSIGTAFNGVPWSTNAIGQPGIPGGMGGTNVEVRFEWRRGSKSKSMDGGERRKRNVTGSTVGADDKGSRRHSVAVDASTIPPLTLPSLSPPESTNPASKRLSFQGFGIGRKETTQSVVSGSSLKEEHIRSPSPNPPASIATNGTTEENATGIGGRTAAGEDDDSDSDIEDSERPWNCYIHVRGQTRYTRTYENGSRSASRRGSRDQLEGELHEEEEEDGEKKLDIKLRVACLAPAPHHPKVIAQIKTPYPLPDVVFDPAGSTTTNEEDVDRVLAARLKQREVDGSRSDVDVHQTNGSQSTLFLTAEEIKDVISCTGLWLVVREGYGGLSRKRKGDGWRLRG
ncbi:hypothetical protein FRC20_005000 [Serendipita sp. 405]|nr:hypothetical protein FRC15_001529 [Serendipita sp. 397]KAG8798960.1 hypothetical protein FRC16_006167 [Serendipita sp. 398]KAG8867750.1 hypothetical protein FRC20_005000 [Serendipita sp. 405]